MFPPSSALPLPPRPSIEHYRKLAKDLLKAGKSDDEKAIGEWVDRWAGRSRNELEQFARDRLSKKCILAEAQFVIARSHGFESWPKFSKHLEALAKSSPVSRFEAAADAIAAGNIATLQRLLRDEPRLIRARSTREHRAMLLHYVAANGVEDYRQKTPENIVKITELLLDAGAEIDATANLYGGGQTTLGLAATSIHPVRAGVLEPLLQTLMNRGASLEPSFVTACVANWRPQAAEFLASRGAPLDFVGAAGIGRLDLVESLFDDASKDQQDQALLYACGYGRNSVVEFLLKRGANLETRRGDGQTALHMAVIGGHLETVRLLLRHHAPLEATNKYGGTVLGQTLWSAARGGDPDLMIAILEALVAAGAQVPQAHVPVNARVDAWLAEHGSRAKNAAKLDSDPHGRESSR